MWTALWGGVLGGVLGGSAHCSCRETSHQRLPPPRFSLLRRHLLPHTPCEEVATACGSLPHCNVQPGQQRAPGGRAANHSRLALGDLIAVCSTRPPSFGTRRGLLDGGAHALQRRTRRGAAEPALRRRVGRSAGRFTLHLHPDLRVLCVALRHHGADGAGRAVGHFVWRSHALGLRTGRVECGRWPRLRKFVWRLRWLSRPAGRRRSSHRPRRSACSEEHERRPAACSGRLGRVAALPPPVDAAPHQRAPLHRRRRRVCVLLHRGAAHRASDPAPVPPWRLLRRRRAKRLVHRRASGQCQQRGRVLRRSADRGRVPVAGERQRAAARLPSADERDAVPHPGVLRLCRDAAGAARVEAAHRHRRQRGLPPRLLLPHRRRRRLLALWRADPRGLPPELLADRRVRRHRSRRGGSDGTLRLPDAALPGARDPAPLVAHPRRSGGEHTTAHSPPRRHVHSLPAARARRLGRRHPPARARARVGPLLCLRAERRTRREWRRLPRARGAAARTATVAPPRRRLFAARGQPDRLGNLHLHRREDPRRACRGHGPGRKRRGKRVRVC